MTLRKLVSPSFALLAAGAPFALQACGGEAPPPAAPTPPAASSTEVAPAPAKTEPAHASFENPGGMWMPEQLSAHVATLKKLGLEIDPKALSEPSSDVLQSIVSLGGCSASFVSEDGLVITNHHCATGALQYNSTPNENLLKDGYVAKTREAERWNGPTSRVYVTQALRDVTKEVREGLEAIKDDAARTRKVEEREKELVAACEKGRPGIRCNVQAFFGGGQYRLIEQLEIRDVRLVFAPHDGVGNFGGEVDNWRWPRQAGDFTIFRAYVGKDGKPADYSASNVPFKSKHHLKLASKPLKKGDLVFVAGYPGRTNRLRTALEVNEALAWRYPHTIRFFEENLALLDRLGKESPELAIKSNNLVRQFGNYFTNYKGVVEGLEKGGLAAEKKKQDESLAAWVAADPQRKAKYGDVFPKMEALVAEQRRTRESDTAFGEMKRTTVLATSALNIVRMAEERPKADSARNPEYQERNWSRREQDEVVRQKRYDKKLDRALFKLALQRAARLPEKERPSILTAVVGPGPVTDARIDAALEKLYAGTKLDDLATRQKLLKTASLADLKKSKDSFVQLGLKLREIDRGVQEREEAFEGAMLLVQPRYVEMLAAYKGSELAPDANGTLRVTYGTVRGYKPQETAPIYEPFTKLSEMVRKAKDEEPFRAPKEVLEAYKGKRFGSYVDTELGEVPVDFLSDLDITGGNSGSATLNARGELVGLAFDGNIESVASDWQFMPKVARTIHVDVRYVLWILDAAYGADHVVKEMGGTPSAH